MLLLTNPQRMPQGSCHRCHVLLGSRRQGCTVGGFRNIAMATIVESAKSSLTFLQQADPWAQKAPKFVSGAKGCQSVNFLVCVSEVGCVQPTVANYSSAVWLLQWGSRSTWRNSRRSRSEWHLQRWRVVAWWGGAECSGKEKGQCSKGDQCSFWQESNNRAKPTPKDAPPSEPPTSKSTR